MKLIQHHWELDVYKLSVETAMAIFRASKSWPKEEMYSLTDQIRRSSRAVSALTAEAWRRRKYEAVFVNKLNEAEGEAAETQTWLEYAVKCAYLDRKVSGCFANVTAPSASSLRWATSQNAGFFANPATPADPSHLPAHPLTT